MSNNSINLKAQQDMFNFVLKAKSAIQTNTAMVLYVVGQRLIQRSPVGNPSLWKDPHWPKGYIPGQFVNNWQLGMDMMPTGIIPGVDPSGAKALLRIKKSIPRWPVGHVYYFTNNLPYANMLEMGHSTQAPLGMVGLTALEFSQIVREVEINYSKGE